MYNSARPKGLEQTDPEDAQNYDYETVSSPLTLAMTSGEVKDRTAVASIVSTRTAWLLP